MSASSPYLPLAASIACLCASCGVAAPRDGDSILLEPGAVLINELLPDPEGADAGYEWLELKNTTDGDIDASGWYLYIWKRHDSTRSTDPFPAGAMIPAGGYLVIGEEYIEFADVTMTLAMGNGNNGDAVYLQDAYGTIGDAVIYGGSNADGAVDESGDVASSFGPALVGDHVLARCPDGNDTDESGKDFQLLAPEEATPGGVNIHCPPTCVAPSSAADVKVIISELMPNPEGSDAGKEWIELYNAGTSTANLCNWEIRWLKGDPLNPSGTSVVPAGDMATGATTLDPGGYLLLAGADAGLEPDFEVELDMGNGSNGDGVHLVDPTGVVADAVCYGSNNDDGMLDEHGEVCESMAPNPGDGRALARCPDDQDTDLSGDDFQHLEVGQETPGYENSCGGVADDCDLADEVAVVMNEVMVNPAGADADKEWLELYNPESFEVDISGWTVAWFKGAPDSPSGTRTIPDDTSIPAGGFLLLGGSEMTGGSPDVVLQFDFGNGTNGDGIHLLDCAGNLRDALVYASPNDDGIHDESGAAATSVAPRPGEEEALARYPDGHDTDLSGDDFCVPAASTPGEPNEPCREDTSPAWRGEG